MNTSLNLPYIPETITVHLGPPSAAAGNVTVDFPSYIKNAASSEIYPTWPDSALYANIYAIISFALNRIYTQYYPSRGYSFNITNDTAIDQSFVPGRDIFGNISDIVDEIFNSYVRRKGTVEPYFTQYCNGTTVTCDGLSQWGTVELADQGLNSIEILRYYYGDDIEIVTNVPVMGLDNPVPEVVLRYGSTGNEVFEIQVKLNRISRNYPAIPKISPVDGIFADETEAAVREFQSIFNLTVDGLVGNATWYAIQRVYAAVKRLNDLASEGVSPDEVTNIVQTELDIGDQGTGVRELQYFLNFIANYNESVPYIEIDGIFGPRTEAAVKAVQELYGIEPTGVVTLETWDYIYRAYRGLLESLPDDYFGGVTEPYPGFPLRIGMNVEAVRYLQQYLSLISTVYPEIPAPSETGVFDEATRASVIAFQERFGLDPTGVVSSPTWTRITSVYRDIYGGNQASGTQSPGGVIENGNGGNA